MKQSTKRKMSKSMLARRKKSGNKTRLIFGGVIAAGTIYYLAKYKSFMKND